MSYRGLLLPAGPLVELLAGLVVGQQPGGDDGGEVVLGMAEGSFAESVFDLFFEGNQPGRNVETDAGGLAREILSVVLEDLELGTGGIVPVFVVGRLVATHCTAVARAGGAGLGDGGGDEGPDPVDGQRPDEPLGQA